MLERSDPAAEVPTSVMQAWTYGRPGATDGRQGAPPIHIHRYDVSLSRKEFSAAIATLLQAKLGTL